MDNMIPSRAFRVLLMVMLILVCFANFFARSLTGIMGEGIKHDLHMTDGQLGLSIGVSFTLFNSILAIPIARAADQGHRRAVMMLSIVAWSVMTFLGGYAHNAWQFTISRIGVAVGEAGIIPVSHAMISLKFKPSQTGFLISILGIGAFMGMAAAPAVGGWASDALGWRGSFFLFGPMSLLLLPLVYFVLGSPAAAVPRAPHQEEQVEAGSLMAFVRQPAFLLLFIGSSLIFVGASSYIVYAGLFLIRTFGLTATAAGRDLAIAFGFPPLFAALLGGWMYDRLRKVSWTLALAVPACCCGLSAIVAIAGWASSSALIATICLACATGLFGVSTGPGFATAQLLASPQMRSRASAIFSLGLGIIGGSIGPILTGQVSDAMSPSVGNESLRYGLSAASLVSLIGSGFLFAAGFAVQRRLGRPSARLVAAAAPG